MKSRTPQGLVRVDIADPGEERLVHQERLEAAAPATDELPEVAQCELRVQRLGTELVVQRADVLGSQDQSLLAAAVEAQPAELAHIADQQLATVVQVELVVDVLV